MPIRGLGFDKPAKKGSKKEPPKKAPKPVGRISTLTPEIQEKVCDLIRRLNTKRTAALCVGVPERTFHSWLEKGRACDPDKDADNMYLQFLQAVEQAEAEAEAGLVQVVHEDTTSKKNAQTALEVLARKNARDWGRVDRVKAEVTQRDFTDEDLSIIRQHMTEDERRILGAGGEAAVSLARAILQRAKLGTQSEQA